MDYPILFAFLLQAEQQFLDMQVIRKKKQMSLTGIQERLKDMNLELDKVQRGDDRYLALLTQEHAIIREENKLLQEIAELEELERTQFSALSSAVRESHEKERTRAERTKYWSVTASVIGAVLGICGTSINNYLRMRELKGMVREQVHEGMDTKKLVKSLTETVLAQQSMIKAFIGDVNAITGQNRAEENIDGVILDGGYHDKLDGLLERNASMQHEMDNIKKLLSQTVVSSADGKIVPLGNEMDNVVDDLDDKIRKTVKSNAVYTVSAVYTGLALTAVTLYYILSGS